MTWTRLDRRPSPLALHAAAVALLLAALAGCGDDGTSGTGGGSAAAGGGGESAQAEAAAVEETCLEHLAVLTAFGEDAGCAPTLDAEQCAALSVEPCAAELQVAHECLTAELSASSCACAEDDSGDSLLECNYDGLCETERAAYTGCL